MEAKGVQAASSDNEEVPRGHGHHHHHHRRDDGQDNKKPVAPVLDTSAKAVPSVFIAVGEKSAQDVLPAAKKARVSEDKAVGRASSKDAKEMPLDKKTPAHGKKREKAESSSEESASEQDSDASKADPDVETEVMSEVTNEVDLEKESLKARDDESLEADAQEEAKRKKHKKHAAKRVASDSEEEDSASEQEKDTSNDEDSSVDEEDEDEKRVARRTSPLRSAHHHHHKEHAKEGSAAHKHPDKHPEKRADKQASKRGYKKDAEQEAKKVPHTTAAEASARENAIQQAHNSDIFAEIGKKSMRNLLTVAAVVGCANMSLGIVRTETMTYLMSQSFSPSSTVYMMCAIGVPMLHLLWSRGVDLSEAKPVLADGTAAPAPQCSTPDKSAVETTDNGSGAPHCCFALPAKEIGADKNFSQRKMTKVQIRVEFGRQRFVMAFPDMADSKPSKYKLADDADKVLVCAPIKKRGAADSADVGTATPYTFYTKNMPIVRACMNAKNTIDCHQTDQTEVSLQQFFHALNKHKGSNKSVAPLLWLHLTETGDLEIVSKKRSMDGSLVLASSIGCTNVVREYDSEQNKTITSSRPYDMDPPLCVTMAARNNKPHTICVDYANLLNAVSELNKARSGGNVKIIFPQIDHMSSKTFLVMFTECSRLFMSVVAIEVQCPTDGVCNGNETEVPMPTVFTQPIQRFDQC